MKKILIAMLVSIMLVIFLLGFVDINKKVQVENKEIFTYSITTIPRDFQNVGSLDKRVQDIVCATSKGLVEVDKDGKIVPSLAESVDVKEDGIEYDFNIKSDIYWSDGSKITTKDISNFFREVITYEDEAGIESLLEVYGARTFRSGEGSFNEGVGIQTTENKIIIRLNSKNPNFLNELSKPQYRVRKNLDSWKNISKNFKDIIYSGDYSITSMDLSEIVLKRNSKSDTNIVETINIVENEVVEVAMAAFEVGNRDIVVDPPKSELTRLETQGKLITSKSDLAIYLAFNPKVDSLTIDGKKEIYSLINKAVAEYQIQNINLLELADGSYFRNDKEDLAKLQARKVMSNVGVDENFKYLEEIVMIAEESVENKELCNFLSEWFKKNSNIVLSYNLITRDEINNMQDETYYNVTLIQCEASVNDRNILYNNSIKFLPNEYKKTVENANKGGNDSETSSEVEDILFNTYSVLPLMFYNKNIAIGENLKDIILDGNGNIYFRKLVQ